MRRRSLEARIAGLRRIGAYEPAGRAPDITTRLDTNENLALPRSVSQGALAAARRSADVRRYPEDGLPRLKAALAGLAGAGASNVIVGNGSDQILDFLLAFLVGRGSSVAVTDPTFSFFESRATLHGIRLIRVPFSEDMAIDPGELEAAAARADAVYLDSPNNPTGYQLPERRLRRLVRSHEGLVIVDEAYAEFGRYSLASMARSQKNLVVTRTLSKSFGLAGLRVGYAIAAPQLAAAFNDILQYPYPVSSVSAEAALAALEPERAEAARQAVELTKSERARVIEGLSAHAALRTFSSEANFVLFDAGAAYMRIHAALAEQGISVRAIGAVGPRRGCLRVTVGSREMNSRFLTAVRDLLG